MPLTLAQIRALTYGPSANVRLLRWMRHPLMLGVNVIAFLFVLFHAVTWFSLTPKAMVIRVKGPEGSGLGHLGAELRRLGDGQPRRRLGRPARVNEQPVE